MEIQLSEANRNFIRQCVAGGDYPNEQAVVEDALLRMMEQQEWQPLKSLLAPRLAALDNGETVSLSIDEVIAEAKERASAS